VIIRDPVSGTGQSVTKGGMGVAKAICQTITEHSNQIEKQSYSAVISVTPTGAGDCFFYITNDNDLDAVVTSIKLQSASAETVQVKIRDTGTVGGTHAKLMPVNRNVGSGKTAEVTCESGVDITGLSGGNVVDQIVAGATMYKWQWQSGLIVPKNRTVSLNAVTGAIAIKATLSFCFLCTCLEP
jgi:hypothetical protein